MNLWHREDYKLLSHPPNRLLTGHLQRVSNNMQNTIRDLLSNDVITTISHEELIRVSRIIGSTHDIVKGTPFFQQYILDPKAKVNVLLKSHALLASLYASWLILNDTKISDTNRNFLAMSAALVIQGHHGSLKGAIKYMHNLNRFRDENVFSRQIESFRVYEDELEHITVNDLRLKSFKQFYSSNWRHYIWYFNHHLLLLYENNFQDKMEPYFIITLLFSVLLDCDNFDAAELERPGRISNIDYNIVKTYIKNNFVQRTKIDRLKNVLFNHIDKQTSNFTKLERGKIFTLTAATGLGKTLASVNFALNLRKLYGSDKHNNYKRIIYVAPFLSILDQNIEILQKVFQNYKNTNLLLMHHHLSPIDYRDDIYKSEGYSTSQSQFMIEGWNAEIIVTTFIQFFATIFGRYTSQLRRLDNAIGSIVILDEVQSIPYELWPIVKKALIYLTEKFDFTVVLMTATQPIIFNKKTDNIIELAETSEEIKSIPQRVKFILENQNGITVEEFNTQVKNILILPENRKKNILIELNTIPTAKECFENISSKTHDIRFLSSEVIPKHRVPRIKEIKKRLDNNNNNKNNGNNKPIVLVCTQVIEAGVDLDFNLGIRDIGPVDSIVQTAGRVNREGLREANDSLFYIYRLMDNRKEFVTEYAKYVYGSVLIDVANSMLQGEDLSIIELVDKYFKEIIDRGSNKKSDKIYDSISELRYEDIEADFRLIIEALYKLPVFVEIDEEAQTIWRKFANLAAMKENNESGTKKRRNTENLELRNQMGQYIIDVDERKIAAAGLSEINGIFKIDFEDIRKCYDVERGFIYN